MSGGRAVCWHPASPRRPRGALRPQRNKRPRKGRLPRKESDGDLYETAPQ
jgi:hypothetical protein